MDGGGTGRQRPHLSLATTLGPVPLGFVQRERDIYLVARDRSARWPVEILREGRAELTLPTGRTEGTVELMTRPQEREEVLGWFRAAYGPDLYARWYDHPARVLRVRSSSDPLPPPSADHYYGWLEAEFDNVADDYDRHITGNRMNRLLRDRSLAVLRPTFRGARSLLEVGCGSGMETLELLRDGHEVHAVDISERMLDQVRRKARAAGVGERLRTTQLAARDLGRLAVELGDGTFEGAYSTYGALNCEPELRPVASAFARFLGEGRPLVLGIYNRWCLFELAGYSLSLQGSRAFGRRENPVPVGSSRFCVDVYAYSVPDIRRAFGPEFAAARIEAVPLLLPPSDLTGYAEKFATHFDRLARWDRAVGRFPLFGGLGDHFLITLRRRGPRGSDATGGERVLGRPPPEKRR